MSLRANDLVDLVSPIFEVDTYRSKIGDDSDFIVVSFTVDYKNVANDLENFIEMGCDFVIDADSTKGEDENGKYKVFIEMERNSLASKHILKIIHGVKKLTGLDNMYFRYFKNFKSRLANEANLSMIPIDKLSYDNATTQHNMNNFSNFFSDSYVNDVNVLNECITFKTFNKKPVNFKIIDFGKVEKIYDKYKSPIIIESSDVLYYTRYIGDYNIMKLKENKFIFHNRNYALVLEGN